MNQDIRDTLQRAEESVRKLRRTNTKYIYISLVSSVLATLIAGLTAFNGPLAGQGPGAWKWTCGLVAVCTATATVFTGLQKQFTVAERLAKANECVGKLKSLIISTELPGSDQTQVLGEYKKIVELYSEYLV